MSEDLQFPIGPFAWKGSATPESREKAIDQIATLPTRLRYAVETLSEEQLNTPYRPGGWTLQQVVHHIADSHMNGYIRFKLALTEEWPTVKPYDQDGWSSLDEVSTSPVAISLNLIDALHARWANLLCSLKVEDFARGYVHPERNGKVSLDETLAAYAWHGEHHLAHIKGLIRRQGW